MLFFCTLNISYESFTWLLSAYFTAWFLYNWDMSIYLDMPFLIERVYPIGQLVEIFLTTLWYTFRVNSIGHARACLINRFMQIWGTCQNPSWSCINKTFFLVMCPLDTVTFGTQLHVQLWIAATGVYHLVISPPLSLGHDTEDHIFTRKYQICLHYLIGFR